MNRAARTVPPAPRAATGGPAAGPAYRVPARGWSAFPIRRRIPPPTVGGGSRRGESRRAGHQDTTCRSRPSTPSCRRRRPRHHVRRRVPRADPRDHGPGLRPTALARGRRRRLPDPEGHPRHRVRSGTRCPAADRPPPRPGLGTAGRAPTPLGDTTTVLAHGGSPIVALSVHGLTAALVTLTGRPPVRETRTATARVPAPRRDRGTRAVPAAGQRRAAGNHGTGRPDRPSWTRRRGLTCSRARRAGRGQRRHTVSGASRAWGIRTGHAPRAPPC